MSADNRFGSGSVASSRYADDSSNRHQRGCGIPANCRPAGTTRRLSCRPPAGSAAGVSASKWYQSSPRPWYSSACRFHPGPRTSKAYSSRSLFQAGDVPMPCSASTRASSGCIGSRSSSMPPRTRRSNGKEVQVTCACAGRPPFSASNSPVCHCLARNHRGSLTLASWASATFALVLSDSMICDLATSSTTSGSSTALGASGSSSRLLRRVASRSVRRYLPRGPSTTCTSVFRSGHATT